MENIICIKNLSFNYKTKSIFKNLNLNIQKGKFTTILGPTGSGKSTLIKLLSNEIQSGNSIFITDKIGIVFPFKEVTFQGENVKDAINILLKSFNLNRKVIEEKLDMYFKELNGAYILEKSTHSLTPEEKQIIYIISILLIDFPIMILDSDFSKLKNITKEKLLYILKEKNLNEGTTIVHSTTDIDESLYGNEIIILNDGSIVIQGETKAVLERKNIFDKLNLNLPFTVELSDKLKFYNIIDRTYYENDELVDAIWK